MTSRSDLNGEEAAINIDGKSDQRQEEPNKISYSRDGPDRTLANRKCSIETGNFLRYKVSKPDRIAGEKKQNTLDRKSENAGVLNDV
jgi:hypothetical protein